MSERFVSRKDLQERYSRGEKWVRELTKHPEIDNFGGRYDPAQVDRVLKAGFRPRHQKPDRK